MDWTLCTVRNGELQCSMEAYVNMQLPDTTRSTLNQMIDIHMREDFHHFKQSELS